MSKNPEENIEEKLRLLEIKMQEESNSNVPSTIEKSTGLSGAQAGTTAGKANPDIILSLEQEQISKKADMHLLCGFGAMLAGVFMFFNHLSIWSMRFGGGTQGIPIILFLIGLGFFFYDYKNKFGWLLIIGGLASIVFSVLLNLQLHLASMSMFTFLLMVFPMVFGAALVAKGMKMHTSIEKKAISEAQRKPEKPQL